MSTSKISALFSTISGLCAAVGGAQAFQVFGDSTPTGHKVTAGIMLVGIVFAYLANSPLFKPSDPAAPGPAGKVASIALLLALSVGVTSCAHIQPVAACATSAIEQAIKDALSDPNWEAELARLVVQDGPAVVECVIEQIIAQESGAKAEHAKAWHAKHVKYVP